MFRPRDRMRVLEDSKRQAANYRVVSLLVPTKTVTAGYDSFTDGPYDISDASIGAAGQTITWNLFVIHARIASPSVTDFNFPNWAQLGYVAGDLLLFIQLNDLGNLQKVMDDDDGYIWADGNTFRPLNVSQIGVFFSDERLVHCRKSSQRVRATGF